jgi:hypothetical protein
MAFLRPHPPRPHPPPRSPMHTGGSDLGTQPVSVVNSARLMYLSMYDNRDGVSESTHFPSPPSSFTYSHNIQPHTLLTPTLLTFMCTQVLWCLPRLTRSRVSGGSWIPILDLLFFLPTQPSVYEVFRFLRFND